jgi:Protein of unknown function (DUF3613)
MNQPNAPKSRTPRAWSDLPGTLGAALLTALFVCQSAGATQADATPAPAAAAASEPFSTEEWQLEQKRQLPQTGRATRQWLQGQSGGEQASANRPTLSGPALRRVHERYLRTFEVDIPQQLRESLPANK